MWPVHRQEPWRLYCAAVPTRFRPDTLYLLEWKHPG